MNPRRLLQPMLCLALLGASSSARAEEGAAPEEAEAGWEIAAAANIYFLPDEGDLAIPILYADRGPLHLEARYNYEDRGAGSFFAGWTFECGDEVTFEATLMAGAVVGSIEGLVPGFETTLSWGPVEWYTEAEYVIDLEDSEGNFFYAWSELSYVPVESFRVGLTTQRTKAFETEREIQRGLHVGLTYRSFSFTAHAFNPDDEKPFYVLVVAAEF